MDTLATDRDLIERVLTERSSIPFSLEPEVKLETIFDRTKDRYAIMLVGWNGRHRVHGSLVHVDLIDGRFWIQRDGTEHGIARDLLDLGVPRERLVLAFRRNEVDDLGASAA
jgi:XisI protein